MDAEQREREKIKILAGVGQKFVQELYYKDYDFNRESIRKFYRPDISALVWNGTAVSGDKIADFHMALPRQTLHRIHTVDSQPVRPGQPGAIGETTVMVTVTGSVEYGTEEPRDFFQSFLLVPQKEAGSDKEVHIIAVEQFRWI
eukprot:TRINITY_DN999_c0_g1_i1.p1 TRINITY_DN999_c0_g1~~TRINITY_DN999_c0_g1_i1.p1  ORF type:complete len:144 (-),score=10.30 TRINITY_DN999_c0_g1_i1:31-462(-)